MLAEQLLLAAQTYFPFLARWVAWTYGRPADLRFGDVGASNNPLHPCCLQLPSIPSFWNSAPACMDLDLFYLDDGVLAGDIVAVRAALATAVGRAAELGLRLNIAKCEAIAVGATRRQLVQLGNSRRRLLRMQVPKGSAFWCQAGGQQGRAGLTVEAFPGQADGNVLPLTALVSWPRCPR